MLKIILLILGIIYAVRRLKLKALESKQFPDVPVDKFQEWKDLELRSIDIFLWATWGLLIISIPVGLAVGKAFPGGVLGFRVLLFVLFLVLLVFSAISGSKAAKLKKQFGIKWPKW
jgi:hypothetical protein